MIKKLKNNPYFNEDWYQTIYNNYIIPSIEELSNKFYNNNIKQYITSTYRTRDEQIKLINQGYKAAKISPHEFGVAIDLLIPNDYKNIYKFSIFLYYLQSIITVDARIGFWSYVFNKNNPTFNFIHFDYAYLIPENIIKDYCKQHKLKNEINNLLKKFHKKARW